MKRVIISFCKIFSFLPALCMMFAIYSFSAQDGVSSAGLSEKVSTEIVYIADKVLDKEWSQDQQAYYVERLNYPVRKAAHMTEYFLLAISVSFPLYVYGLRGFPLLIVAGAVCVGFACMDEYHQSFVEGRGPSKRDVCIDSIGAFIGIILVRIVCWTTLQMARPKRRRRRGRQLNHNRR
ncbi:MAG: VanZ family protein [Lachnospiraceae bacterium]|nr:VanZ family protein [Lachnospiraceae bacterium]MDD3616530.1 VanZ family protein [Lachnospiraceae bacterium]